ncbi:uncharacterized protein LOC103524116 [Trichonephila clavipes]|uniref:Uncharacterized protein LOC103524116 n=1 Tax=Trichonephila clavipes TaxID=2585209 RepID=A0A8X6STN1_TRICX|nr:uncharacterized protein LOC103524116 [Trichonephila clavipes]
MQLQTEISSSSERRQYSALSLGELLMRKEHFWLKYIPSQTRLKTQHTFLFEFQRLANVFGVSDNRLPLFIPTIFPGDLRYASAHLDLVLPVHKHNSLLSELRSAALATIHERYPDQDWLHIFTDGSATAPFGRAGAGAFSNSFNLKEPFSAWSDNFDGEIYAIFMAFRAISTTPGLNMLIFIDSQATIETVYLATIYSHQNLSSSANNLSTHFFAPEERSFSNGSHLIAETNKPTSWPKRLRRCIHLANRCLFETPSNFSGTNCDRREFSLLQTWLLANLGLVCSMAKDVLSFLPYLGWRVWHVSESSPDMITYKPICLRLAWLIHRSALSVISCQ